MPPFTANNPRHLLCFGGPMHGRRVTLPPGVSQFRTLKVAARLASTDPTSVDEKSCYVTYSLMPIVIQDAQEVSGVMVAPGVTLAEVWKMALEGFSRRLPHEMEEGEELRRIIPQAREGESA